MLVFTSETKRWYIIILSAICLFLSCDRIENDVNNDDIDNNFEKIPLNEHINLSIEHITYSSVEFKGSWNISEPDLSSYKVILYYSDNESFNVDTSLKLDIDFVDGKQDFRVSLTDLNYDTQYNYCLYIKLGLEEIYTKTMTFTTMDHPYSVMKNIDMSIAVDLSSSVSANSYIVSTSGVYKFRTTVGNSNEPLDNIESCSILWETFGTDSNIDYCDLICGVLYKDGYIAFETSETYQEGNAVIAAKDARGTILWSWHIWFTDVPDEQIYHNDSGVVMDRNLGALSSNPDDVGSFGLLYQWGRKDPFIGSVSVEVGEAKSTLNNFNVVMVNSNIGTVEYSVEHPTTFISADLDNMIYNWHYSTGIDLWTTSDKAKSIYDPCPAGWRIPDGGAYGLWANALISYFGTSWNDINDSAYLCYTDEGQNQNGINFSEKFGHDDIIWYPSGGIRDYDGNLRCDGMGLYWSASLNGYMSAHCLSFGVKNNRVFPSTLGSLVYAGSVRCVQE